MISIAIFNNKGGVGKTTFLCNMASFLSVNRGKRILVIDADPQCNTTSYVIDEDNYYSMYFEPKQFTISNIFQPIRAGEGYISNFSPTTTTSFGFDLIAGNPDLAACEDFISGDWSALRSGELRGAKTTMVFSHLLTLCPHYDYVFFDMGPSLGAINRTILLAVDYFITPISSDIFSVMALDNIGDSLSSWKNAFNKSFSDLSQRDRDILKEIKNVCDIGFLGYVEQQYISKTVSGEKRAVQSYEKILGTIPDKIKKAIIEKINIGRNININYNLGSIPNFYSLIPMSQTAHKPIFLLNNADGVVGAHYQKVNDYRKLMDCIADRLFENMEALS